VFKFNPRVVEVQIPAARGRKGLGMKRAAITLRSGEDLADTSFWEGGRGVNWQKLF
jgi:hypothetical protein